MSDDDWMSELVGLLHRTTLYTGGGEVSDLPETAADEIARLTAEVEKLREMQRTVLVEQGAMVATLTARVAELEDSLDRRKLARRLVARYNDSPLRIAELCDGAIDPTGRLLGYVRDEARAALTPHTYGEDMSNITIPPAVLEAARLAVAKAIIEDKDGIEAACLAMLRAWPGMSTRTGIYTDIILPLTETPDDHND